MTDDENDLLAPLNYWSNRIEEASAQINATNLDIKLPAAAGRQFRNLAEAVSACEQVVESFVYKRAPPEAVLRQVAGHLRRIHRRLDDVILPATILD